MSTAELLSTPSFTDRVFNLLQRVDYRRADRDEDREAIYRLRYDAYVREGAISTNFSSRFSDAFDDIDNAWIFGVYIDGRLCSSIRLNINTPDCPDLPALHVFSDLLTPEIEAGRIIIDPTRFVADQTAARWYPELPYLTVRIGALAAEFFGADMVLATVRAEHQAFYRRVFGHKPICPPRPYPTLSKPISLMTMDYPAGRDRMFQRYPFFRASRFEQKMLFLGQVPADAALPSRPATEAPLRARA